MNLSIRKFFFAILFVSGLFMIPDQEVDAAWDGWESVPEAGSNCEVRAWVDAYNYYSGADTVEAKVESNGNCSQIDYQTTIQDSDFYAVHRGMWGYFNYASPIKTFYIDDLFENPVMNGQVVFHLYVDSDYAGAVASHKINIH